MTHVYSIIPKKPIKTIPELGFIRTPKTLELTKDQVLECLKYGTVYRRFDPSNIIKVSVNNIDRLHNDVFMTESEYNDFINVSNTEPDIIPASVEEIVSEQILAPDTTPDFNVESQPEIVTEIEEAAPIINAEDTVAEIVVPTTVVEETSEEIVANIDQNESEAKTEEKMPEEKTNQAPKTNYSNGSKTVVNYNGNKKRH